MSDVLAVGIVGAGQIAGSHLAAIAGLPNMRVAAVMDVDRARAESAAAPHRARAYTTFDALLDDEAVQAVHICTPHHLHADQAVRSAETGRHVLVEKPMALTVADCDRMIAASERANRILMVGQVMRYYPRHRQVRAMLADGAIGTVGHLARRRYSYFDTRGPQSAYGAWYMDPTQAGNSVLYSFGSHEYDILHWFLGSPIVRVYAQGSVSDVLCPGEKDSISALLTHASGAVSLVSQSVVSRGGGADQVIIGSAGTITLQGRTLQLDGEEVPVAGSDGDGMSNQVAEFAACCLEGREPDASGRSVRHTIGVLEAVQRSLACHEPVAP